MTNVTSLADARAKREPHVAGEAYCMACNHHWTGVWPTGTVELECPQCKCMKGRSVFEIAPQADALVYECACGNQLYHVLSDRIHCPNCGQQTSYESLAKSF